MNGCKPSPMGQPTPQRACPRPGRDRRRWASRKHSNRCRQPRPQLAARLANRKVGNKRGLASLHRSLDAPRRSSRCATRRRMVKQLLTPLLAISLLSGTAVMAQSPQSDNHNQKDSPDNQKQDNKKRSEQRGSQSAPAAPPAQTSRQRSAPAASQNQVTRNPADRQMVTQQQRAEQQRATQQRAEQQRATQQRATQQRAEQQRATQQRAEQQRRARQRQRWTRGDRLPEQYRQESICREQLATLRPSAAAAWL